MITIEPVAAGDRDALQVIFRAVVAAGDSYVHGPELDDESIDRYWYGAGVECWVARVDGSVRAMYRLVANQPGRGDHVANAAFMVAPDAQRLGLGRRLGEHCLERARVAGFRAMQFNFVVATNAPAVRLWQTLGFAIVGTLPKVFRHVTLGDVDAHVMHRFL